MATVKKASLPLKTLTKERCVDNYKYWKVNLPDFTPAHIQLKETISLSKQILPAHTFSYKYVNASTGSAFYPIKQIFGYDEIRKEFTNHAQGVVAKAYRAPLPIPNLHMKTSERLGHDVFIFAYHGVHNPYHRKEDPAPVRPFGLFIDKARAERFPYSHGSPCDVADENPIVDKKNLDKYYLLPKDLRILKGNQIYRDKNLMGFWDYFGDPEKWKVNNDYGQNIYQKTGEFRYFKELLPKSIRAILWPFFTDVVLPDGTMDIDENLDLLNAFERAFPEISVIKYNHDVGVDYDWSINLVEASYYSTRYYILNNIFPKDANIAKQEILNL